MHKLFVRLLLIVALLPSLFAEAEPATVTVGMPLADLMKLKGMPQTKAALGKKSIYRWADMQVTLVEGKVESYQVRNTAAEKEDARERAQTEARKKYEAEAKARSNVLDSREATTYSRLDANAANRATEERLYRAAALQQQIRSIEQELSDDAKRSSFKGPPPLSAEARAFLNLRLDNLRRELINIR